MGIVPDFQYDIFVSYAHLNNQKMAAEDEGWVTDLCGILHKKLMEETRAKPSIWFDRRDLDGRLADTAIAKAIYQSAVLLSVVSPAYTESSYCLAEAAEFCSYRHPAFPLAVRGHSRVIVVGYDESTRPIRDEFRQAPAVSFFDTNEATGGRTRYVLPRRSDPNPYWERLDLLVRHLLAVLREMQRGPTSATEIADHSGTVRQFPVYMAEATDDLQSERASLQQVLERVSTKSSSPILPSRSILQGVSVREACRDGLGRANASVHLINATAGRIWGDAGKPLAQLELEEALGRAGKPRPLVWIAPDLDVTKAANPEYRAFLEQLKNRTFEVRNPDVRTPELFDMPFDKFLTQVESRLAPPPATSPQARKRSAGGLQVYISHQASGAGRLPELISTLRSRKYSVSHLDHQNTAADIARRHAVNLKFCDGLLVLYEAADVDWAEDLAQQARLTALTQKRPKRLGVVNGEPEAPDDFGLIDDLVIPIRVKKTGEFAGLDEFLAALEQDDNA